MGPGGRVSSDDVGNEGLSAVFDTCFSVFKRWLRRGSRGMKSSI